MDAIITNELSKTYPRGVTALRGLNLRVPEGTAFACVGGARSGKTTLIRLLSGMCRPTSGDCFVLGIPPYFEEKKLHVAVGTVLNTARLYEDLTLWDNLRYFAALCGMEENDALDRVSLLLHRLDIWERRDDPVRELPTGVVVRASLARALVGNPRVLLVDEPGGGLDRETADHMQELLSYLVTQEGMTVLFSTRNMAYAERLCQGFAILQEGVLLGLGDLETLRKRVGLRFRAYLRLGEEDTPPEGFSPTEDGGWQKDIRTREEFPRLVSRAVQNGSNIYEARVIRPSLGEIYTAFLEGRYGRAGDDDGADEERDGPADVPGGGQPEENPTEAGNSEPEA